VVPSTWAVLVLNAFACRTAHSQDRTGERHGRQIPAISTSLPDTEASGVLWGGRCDDEVIAAMTTCAWQRLTTRRRLGAVTCVLVAVADERKALAELQRATNELLPDPEGELR
jgi:hypothetical protein